MAARLIIMSKVKQIIRLKQQGRSLQGISKAVGCSRNTVKKYLRLIEAKGLETSLLLKKTDEELENVFTSPAEKTQDRYQQLKEMFPYIEKELTRTGVTRWMLWGEYKNKYPNGYSYSHFCEYLQSWRKANSATMHLEHSPGDKIYIDFTGKKLQVVDYKSGQAKDVEVYISMLGYSQLTYVEAVYSQKKEDFIKATANSLQYFGGVARVLVPDNLKSAVTKADKYEAEINESFLDFANHYGTTVLPARSYKPRDKALVENAVANVYRSIYAPLRNKTFYSIEALNEAIWDLLEVYNQRPFQKTKISRREKFEKQENHTLFQLPRERYEIKYYRQATVMKNSHVQLSDEKVYYSVPFRYIGKKVKIIYTGSHVSVFYKGQRIAFHRRLYKRFAYSTVKEHLPSTHQFVSEWSPDKFLSWAGNIDPVVKDYISKILESKNYPEQAYRSCVGILSQVKKVGKERLIKAVTRATYFQSYSYKTIKNILEGKLDRLEDITENQREIPFHENIRGKNQYQ